MPNFIKTNKDEKKWNRAKEIAVGRGLKSNTQEFWKFSTYVYEKMIKNKNKNISEKTNNNFSKDIESRYMTGFKTWWDKLEKKSQSSKLLARLPKNKFDTTIEKTPNSPKKTDITVWGAPSNFDYIRN